MNLYTLAGALAVVGAMSPVGRAQTNQTFGSAPGDFTIERVLTLSSASAPAPPNFPAPVLAALQSGALELHQILVYNSAQRTLEESALVVPGGSPLPLPSPGSATVGDHYIIQVDSASTTSAPSASAVLVGHVTSNDVPTPFGNITGAIVTLSFGFQGSGPATHFGPIYESVAPLYGLYTPSGIGSMSLTPSTQSCSVATLKGSYVFQIQGSIQTQSGPSAFGPYVDSGRFVADGAGNIIVTDAGNLNGVVFAGRTFPIAYMLDSTCSGTFQFPGGAMNVVASNDGHRLSLLFTYPAAVVAAGSAMLQ